MPPQRAHAAGPDSSLGTPRSNTRNANAKRPRKPHYDAERQNCGEHTVGPVRVARLRTGAHQIGQRRRTGAGHQPAADLTNPILHGDKATAARTVPTQYTLAVDKAPRRRAGSLVG